MFLLAVQAGGGGRPRSLRRWPCHASSPCRLAASPDQEGLCVIFPHSRVVNVFLNGNYLEKLRVIEDVARV